LARVAIHVRSVGREARRIARAVAHPRLGDIDLMAQPCEITGFERSIDAATPDLGEDTVDILKTIGFGPSEIEMFRMDRII
jgi:crotonobetainyl-CoA:carnitine CoA-transferase CaiB-like acyl-CoA transferase